MKKILITNKVSKKVPSKAKVLIIEDDSVLRDTIQKKLNIEGYQAITAVDGEIGLKKIKAVNPDLVLLDILMPIIDGMEVLEKMKKDKELEKIPVIIISNSGQPVEIKKILELGVVDYLIKANFNPDEVVAKVRKVFERQKAKCPTILIIEDDKFLRDLLEKKLKKADYKILSETDGEKGLKTCKDKKPDFVLLDILLPEMRGFEVLQEIKQDQDIKDIPVIILSNLGEKEDIEKGLELGASDYIIKSNFTLDEIIVKIKNVLK